MAEAAPVTTFSPATVCALARLYRAIEALETVYEETEESFPDAAERHMDDLTTDIESIRRKLIRAKDDLEQEETT